MPQVFIVDPDSVASGALKARLTDSGFTATVLADAEEVFASVKDWAPELVILADELGDTSGFSLCNKLKRIPGCAGLPVFLLVGPGNSGAAGAHRSSRTPAAAYLSRPAEPAALFEQLRLLFPELALPSLPEPVREAAPLAPPPLPPPLPKPVESLAPEAGAQSEAPAAERHELESRQAGLEAELAAALTERDQARQRAEQSDAALEALTVDLKNAGQELAAQQRLAAERQRAMEQSARNLDELARTLEESKAREAKQAGTLEAAVVEVRALRASLVQSEAERAKLREEAARERGGREKAEAHAQGLAKELTALRAQLQAAADAHARTAAGARQAAEGFEAGRAAQETVVRQARELGAALKKETARAEKAEGARERADAEVRQLARRLAAADAELAEARKVGGEQEGMARELAELRKHLVEEELRRTELERARQRLEEALQVQTAVSDDWRERVAELEAKLERAERARAELARKAEPRSRAEPSVVIANSVVVEPVADPRLGELEAALAEVAQEKDALKKKLIRAEAAAETAAHARSRIVRLEEALRQATGAVDEAPLPGSR